MHAVEDLLMALDVNIEADGSIHYTLDSVPKSDRRTLEHRFNIVTATRFTGESCWLETPLARGNGGETTLIRVRDMQVPASNRRNRSGDSMPLNPG